MMRLIEKGLMFGNLIPVASPALIERYNRALEKLSGKRTALPDFHVDLSGFSPEIADELNDWQYLNPNGCNRQFILLTTEQKAAPLLEAKFSMSRSILRNFIEANETQLFALTARDAVLGELENSVFEVSSPQRLFDIRRITLTADTTRGHVAHAEDLQKKIEQFRTEPDAWWDDVLIGEMIGLAKRTGDITRNPIHLDHPTFTQANYWTAHFGGLYLFRDVATSGVVSVGPKEALGKLPVDVTLDLADRNGIARFLADNELVEPIVTAKGADAAAILRQKMDFILVDAAATLGQDIAGGDRRELRRLARMLGAALPDEFHELSDLVRWAEGGGAWPRISSDHPAYFYTVRAAPHPDRDIVNQLLAELSPKDVRQLFICHKPLFYQLYRGWPEEKKSFVADFLEAEYQMDKAGARAALFGPEEPEMEEPEPPAREELITLVGPWGAVRR
ncbi:hypothetical protein CLV78_10638 [Aliiruegeria haliotis]|uniref:Uncharacterized protein n=1 Tax=Aliiruegeria haliotis TaxID=1280846 RepID=A0A2T0RMX0_9RHOB|nr:DUF6638 family protein [Aliiruegeria haliotis]PRY22498.1 hypothetical protein CLV78_10638 [Aliiruegeria haliotis]